MAESVSFFEGVPAGDYLYVQSPDPIRNPLYSLDGGVGNPPAQLPGAGEASASESGSGKAEQGK